MRSASFSTRKLESSLGIDAMPAKALGLNNFEKPAGRQDLKNILVSMATPGR
jgi:hypothetical protein